MHVCNHHFTGFSFHARAGLATGKMAAPRFVAVLPHLPVCCTAWRPWRRLCSRVSHVFDMLVPRIASVPACNVGRSVHCRIVRGLQQKAVLGSLHIIVVRCAHACWLARAICVPIRACVRVRTAVMCCGSLASDRGLGECGQLAYHGAQKERFHLRYPNTWYPHGAGGFRWPRLGGLPPTSWFVSLTRGERQSKREGLALHTQGP